MVKILEAHLVQVIDKVNKLDLKEKELICDEIYKEQPNLLASVLVQQKMGNTLEEVDVLLNILIVLHLTVKKSGQEIVKITEQMQEQQYKILVSTIKFSEGLESKLIYDSLNQYIINLKQPILLAYAIGCMNEAHFFTKKSECSKYLIMAGVNLVNCIMNAKKIT